MLVWFFSQVSFGAKLCLATVANHYSALVAAQAHSPKQDRAVVISARNFIRALGGSAGLAIASAIFSNTLVNHIPEDIPENVAMQIQEAIFDVPNTTGLTEAQKIMVYDLYAKAARSVFYLWVGAMGLCLALMIFIKDKGLVRKEDQQIEVAESMQISRDESVSDGIPQGAEPATIQEKANSKGDIV